MKTFADRLYEAAFLLMVLAGMIMFFRAGHTSSTSRKFDPVLREHFSKSLGEGERLTSSHCELVSAGITEDTGEQFALIDYTFRVRSRKGVVNMQRAVLVNPLDGKYVISDDPYLKSDGEGNLYAWASTPDEEPEWLD